MADSSLKTIGDSAESRLGFWLTFGVGILLWVLLYLPHIITMMDNWWTDPNYSHGFIVPLISGWLIWRQREELARMPWEHSWWGLPVMAASAVVFLVGMVGHEYFLRRISISPMLWGLVLTAWGWPIAKKMAFPFAYLLLMVPIPYVIYDSMAFPLRLIAASLAGWMLDWFMPVFVEGNVIHMPSTVMDVVDACSGIRSLISLLAASVILAYLMLENKWLRILIVLLVPPVAVLTNSFRVVVTGFLAEYVSPALIEGAFHDFVGWAVFMVSFAGLALLTLLLRKLSVRPGQKET